MTKSGMILINFLKDDRSILRLFDLNLNLIGEMNFDDLIINFNIIELVNGSTYTLISLRSKSLLLFNLPNFQPIWIEPINQILISFIYYIEEKNSFLIGTEEGKLFLLTTFNF